MIILGGIILFIVGGVLVEYMADIREKKSANEWLILIAIICIWFSGILFTIDFKRSLLCKDFNCKILESQKGQYKVLTSSDEVKYIRYVIFDK